jgi:hypothetical protein
VLLLVVGCWCCSSRVLEVRCVFLSRFSGGVLLPAELRPVLARLRPCVRAFLLLFGLVESGGGFIGGDGVSEHRETMVISAFLCSSIGLAFSRASDSFRPFAVSVMLRLLLV